MYKAIRKDCEAYLRRKASVSDMIIFFIKNPGFRVTFLYRLGSFFKKRDMYILAVIFNRFTRWASPVDIENSAEIGAGLILPHPLSIVIGGKVKIGENCKIMQGVTIGGSMGKVKEGGQTQPVIGNNVFIGPGAVIIGPVSLGDNITIGANTVVTKDIHSNTIVYGYPLVIKNKDDNEN